MNSLKVIGLLLAWGSLTLSAAAAVLRPWTPVQVRADQLSCWGRTYDFRNELLPAQVVSLGQPLLAAPVRLLAGSPFRLTGQRVVSHTPEKVVWRREGSCAGLTVVVEVTVEYDGLAWFVVRLPRGGQVPRLSLEIPFRTAGAPFIHYSICDGAWIRPFPFAGAVADLPPDWHYRFLSEMWLGDDERGLSWCCESDEAWDLQAPDRATALLTQGQERVLRFTWVDHEKALARGTTFAFGLEATPSRPLPADWRSFRVFHYPGYYGLWRGRTGEGLLKGIDADALVKAGVKVVALHAWWANEVCGFKPADEADFRAFLDQMHRHGLRVQVYFAANMASQQMIETVPGASDWPRGLHPPEWGIWKGGLHDEKQYTGRCVCPRAKGWADHLVKGIARMLDDYPIDGIYWDHHPLLCAAAAHGCGYERTIDGQTERRPTAAILPLRDIVRRVYLLCQEKRKDPIITLHSSWIIVPAVNFADTLMDGENMARARQSYLANGGTIEEMPLSLWRAELRAQKWGLIPEYCMYPSPDHLPTDQVLSYAWLHDVGVRAMDQAGLAALLPSWQAFDRADLTHATFHGYWDLPRLVEGSDRVKVSAYCHERACLLVVANPSAEDQTVTIHTGGLLRQVAAATDAITGSKLELAENGDLPCTVPARRFRLIRAAEGSH